MEPLDHLAEVLPPPRGLDAGDGLRLLHEGAHERLLRLPAPPRFQRLDPDRVPRVPGRDGEAHVDAQIVARPGADPDVESEVHRAAGVVPPEQPERDPARRPADLGQPVRRRVGLPGALERHRAGALAQQAARVPPRHDVAGEVHLRLDGEQDLGLLEELPEGPDEFDQGADLAVVGVGPRRPGRLHGVAADRQHGLDVAPRRLDVRLAVGLEVGQVDLQQSECHLPARRLCQQSTSHRTTCSPC